MASGTVLDTTIRRVQSRSYIRRLAVVKIRVKDVLDDPESGKWSIRRAR